MIRGDDEEHVVAALAQRTDRLRNPQRALLRGGNDLAMLGAAELEGMLGVIGLADPEQMQQRVAGIVERRAEATSRLCISDGVVRDVQTVLAGDGPHSRCERAVSMVEPAVAVGILHVGRTRRGVGVDNGPPVGTQPFGEGRAVQSSPGGAAQAIAKIRRPYGHGPQSVAFVERDGIAGEPVTPRPAACGDGRGVNPCCRRKYAALIGEPPRVLDDAGKPGRVILANHVGAQAVDNHDHGAFHGGDSSRGVRCYQLLRSSRSLRNTVFGSGSSGRSGNASRSRAITEGLRRRKKVLMSFSSASVDTIASSGS